jgi:hypothetical protein
MSRLSQQLELWWDGVEAHIRRHPRKYALAAFVVIFLPQWLPAARNAATWVWSLRPGAAAITAAPTQEVPRFDVFSFSWNWVTVPTGLALLALILWETRRIRPATRHVSRSVERDGSEVAATSRPIAPHFKRIFATFAGGHAEPPAHGRAHHVHVKIQWRKTAQGLHVEVINETTKVIRDFKLFVHDMTWFLPARGVFVEVDELHASGPFGEVQLPRGDTRLFPASPVTFPFLMPAGAALQFQGKTLHAALDIVHIRKSGRWKVDFRYEAHGTANHIDSLLFEWEPGRPAEPYAPSAVTAAPALTTSMSAVRNAATPIRLDRMRALLKNAAATIKAVALPRK